MCLEICAESTAGSVWSSTQSTARVKARWGHSPSLTKCVITSVGFIAFPTNCPQLLSEGLTAGRVLCSVQAPRMLGPCGITQRPFCFCSFFRVHVGNVGHRQNGFHGNLHFRDASEKICVGERKFSFNSRCEQAQRWAAAIP